ncbi:MAG: transcription repressor NadR [Eubacteriales bacterium]|nr:transcription repressor NadR [Eubacteriales bacterium]
MTGEERRDHIIQMIRNTTRPIPAKALAADFEVSRQVIVQDIALIRAAGFDILSTNRGYILLENTSASRVFKVSHTDEQMVEELSCIVDLGGKVQNVMINHRVYGHIEAPLHISSRKDISVFVDKLSNSKSGLLKNTTSGYHYHTVEADSEKTLDEIEDELRKRGFLVAVNS